MLRSTAVIVGLILLPTVSLADDGIPPETVIAVKRATVFVRVEGDDWKATGSGFVVAADKDSVLIATNHHVISLPANDKKRLTPSELIKSLKVPTVTAVFNSGTKTEYSLKAEVIAADTYYDLAILRVTGLKDPPAPIKYENPPQLSETMTIYTFGFPLGQALSTSRGGPAITVGKGSVSSFRNDDNGELAIVQLNCAMNPGNSGGPVVDSKGQLVGVAVAIAKDSQGIAFAVPPAELGKVMKGRVGGVYLRASKTADGKLAVKAELGVIDPTSAVRGVTLHYLAVPPNANKPKYGQPLEQQTGAKKVELKVEGGIATGEFNLDRSDGELFVQAIPEGGAGNEGTQTCDFPLKQPKGPDTVALNRPAEAIEEPSRTVPPTLTPGFGRPVNPFVPAMPTIKPFQPINPFTAVPGFPNPLRPIGPINPINPYPFPAIPSIPGPGRPIQPVRPFPFPFPPIPTIPGRPNFPGRP